MAVPEASKKPHVAIFPLMSQGHTIPLIDLSKILSSRGVRVTIITTPSNAPSILSRLSGNHNITLAKLPFSFGGCQNTSELPSLDLVFDFFIAAQLQLRSPFEALLRRMRDSNDLPSFVVSDSFLSFTLSVCQDFNVPRLVFHGMGVSTMAVFKAIQYHQPYLSTVSGFDSTVNFPGQKLPYTLTLSDLSLDDPISPEVCCFLKEADESDINSWGVLVNSFSDLEMASLPFLESFYSNGARAWCVGPLCLYDDDKQDESKPSDDDVRVSRWLDELSPGSVLYVAFGSQSYMTNNAQLDELARGLVESREPFLWVIKSSTWSVPKDIIDRVNDKGLVVSGWVNQRKIMSHASVGGFLSNCGWNSILESLSVGIPALAWPMFADQIGNAKLVIEGLETGIRLKPDKEDGLVSRTAISVGVTELMSGEKGRAARERARVLGCAARRAVKEGGSSCQTLDELLLKLCGIRRSIVK